MKRINSLYYESLPYISSLIIGIGIGRVITFRDDTMKENVRLNNMKK